jgi:hypothetical protein
MVFLDCNVYITVERGEVEEGKIGKNRRREKENELVPHDSTE